MNCKKCGNLIDKDANFCPYCGEKTQESTYQESNYEDPFKDLRIENNHASQYEYQKNYSKVNNIQYKDDLLENNASKKINQTLLGLLLGIISVFLCFIPKFSFIGIISSIISLILVISGMKKTSRGMKVIAIIITIFTFIISIMINICILVSSLEISFSNGYNTTLGQYFKDTFYCSLYEPRMEGYWLDEDNELLYLDGEGNYYIYKDKDELTDNYYYGTYERDAGIDLNSEEVLYGDDDYCLYQVKTSDNKVKVDGVVYHDTIDFLKNGFTLKLSKENYNWLVLVSKNNEEILFKKQ